MKHMKLTSGSPVMADQLNAGLDQCIPSNYVIDVVGGFIKTNYRKPVSYADGQQTSQKQNL